MADKKKGKSKESPLLDDRQRRRERITLGLMILALPTAIFGMVVISTFLSRGPDNVNQFALYGFLVCAAIMTAGIIFQKVTKKRPAA
jgi:hypothetical protein